MAVLKDFLKQQNMEFLFYLYPTRYLGSVLALFTVKIQQFIFYVP